MLTSTIQGLAYHQVHREELMRVFQPARRRWQHRERNTR
jgi:hypothetical protein